jgi:hypothetical protein
MNDLLEDIIVIHEKYGASAFHKSAEYAEWTTRFDEYFDSIANDKSKNTFEAIRAIAKVQDTFINYLAVKEVLKFLQFAEYILVRSRN